MTLLSATLEHRSHQEPFLARISTNSNLPKAIRATEALLLERETPGDYGGFKAVFVKEGDQKETRRIVLPSDLHYLGREDIVRYNPQSGALRVMYRRNLQSNSLLVTERCNSKCLMCSQPPRDIDDGFLVEELLAAIPLIAQETQFLGFTGGEITLLHSGFIALLRAMKSYLPATRLDVLTNGRLLSYLQYAQKIAGVGHPNLFLCIPLYSDVDSLHDFVVQAKGAFDQTTRGILNLARAGVSVEVRVVIHQQTYQRLPQLAEFIARNFPFVSHVALMGLEMTGFTKANLDALWIDPIDYQAELAEAVDILEWAGLPASIYNHPLCVLPERLWGVARHSISDWKNVYMPECAGCSKMRECGGFFASAPLRYSAHIKPFS